MFAAREEFRMRAADQKYLDMVVKALESLRSGKELTRFELFPDAGAELRTFQKNVLKAFLARGIAVRIEGGDPQSPTVKFTVRSRQALENLSEDDEALMQIVDAAWPLSTAVSDKPPPLEVVKKFEDPKPEPEPTPPAPVAKPFALPPLPPEAVEEKKDLAAALEDLKKVVSAEGQSIVYIRERLDELCRYIGQTLPAMEEKVNSLHKEWKGEK